MLSEYNYLYHQIWIVAKLSELFTAVSASFASSLLKLADFFREQQARAFQFGIRILLKLNALYYWELYIFDELPIPEGSVRSRF